MQMMMQMMAKVMRRMTGPPNLVNIVELVGHLAVQPVLQQLGVVRRPLPALEHRHHHHRHHHHNHLAAVHSTLSPLLHHHHRYHGSCGITTIVHKLIFCSPFSFTSSSPVMMVHHDSLDHQYDNLNQQQNSFSPHDHHDLITIIFKPFLMKY